MTHRDDRVNAAVIAVAIACLLPLRLMTGASAASPPADCEGALAHLQQLRGNVAMDAGVTDRANTLADTAAQTGEAPGADQINRLAEDSLESLDLAASEVEDVGEAIGRSLDTANLARQGRAWRQGMDQVRHTRKSLSDVWRPNRRRTPPVNFGRAETTSSPGVGRARGVGATTIYQAAESFETATQNLEIIAKNSVQFLAEGPMNMVMPAKPDTPPTPNPSSAGSWAEFLNRLRSAAARTRAANRGLRTARALQAREFQQAKQNASEMRSATEEAADAVDALQRTLRPCVQLQSWLPSQVPAQPASPVPPVQAPAVPEPAARSGGGMGGLGTLALLGAGAAAAYGAYYYSQMYACGAAPALDYGPCSSGNCSSCRQMLSSWETYCNCVTQKGAADTSDCRGVTDWFTDQMGRRCEPVPETR